MEIAAQVELFPLIEAKVAKKSFLRQYMDAQEIHGSMVTPQMASFAMEVSKQYVHQMLDSGKLAFVEINGHRMVPVVAVEAWLAGRKITFKGMWKHAFKEKREAKQRLKKVA